MSFPRVSAFMAIFALIFSLSTWLAWAQSPFSTDKEIDLVAFDQQLYTDMLSHNWQAFEENLAIRQKQLDRMGSDSAAQAALLPQLLQQQLWMAHNKMRFCDYPQAFKSTNKALSISKQIAADKKNLDDTRLLLIAETEAFYASLYAGNNAVDKGYRALIPLDSSLVYLERARRTAAQLKDKKSFAASDLNAFIYFVACRTHIT
jgi:DNA polymerase III alpha subunit (gram-positive type)